MKILALDLGKFNTTCCYFDTKTRKARFLSTPTQREHLAAVFRDNQADLVVMEACGPSGWINDLAQSLGRSTLVCSTNGSTKPKTPSAPGSSTKASRSTPAIKLGTPAASESTPSASRSPTADATEI